MRHGFFIATMLALLAGPASAAPAAQEKAGDTAKDAPAAPALPASMQSHGVIGHVPPLTGLPLLDPEILARMRERLIVLSQEPDK